MPTVSDSHYRIAQREAEVNAERLTNVLAFYHRPGESAPSGPLAPEDYTEASLVLERWIDIATVQGQAGDDAVPNLLMDRIIAAVEGLRDLSLAQGTDDEVDILWTMGCNDALGDALEAVELMLRRYPFTRDTDNWTDYAWQRIDCKARAGGMVPAV